MDRLVSEGGPLEEVVGEAEEGHLLGGLDEAGLFLAPKACPVSAAHIVVHHPTLEGPEVEQINAEAKSEAVAAEQVE